ncbi:MAG TPA: YggS family pyridoxal phosphate-dependent enzyme [Thermoanaerobaculia bacterium]|nr:YggS family pyridoxal phosphate-dependent enzyme [Thermoanaerobaculia bacterium]
MGRAVGERVAAVRRRIAAACARCGRRPESVTLVAASKGQPPDKLLAAWGAGVRVFGENRVQEAAAKQPALPPTAEWHLLGPLQSNKVRAAVELFVTIHSLDREKIVRALDREAARRGVARQGFIEVNVGEEPSKHGFAPAGLIAALRPLAGLAALRLVGLMAIPPYSEDPEGARPWFRRLAGLRDELRALPGWRDFPGLLSMGMSHDFEVAIEEGATHVRVGTELFGPRDAATA